MHLTLLSTLNRNYWLPFEVLAASVLRLKQPETRVEWHLFTDEEPGGWNGWLADMQARYASQLARFVVHPVPGLTDGALPLRGRARAIMYARLHAPGLLAEQSPRVLYLDADLLALRPLESLWATDLGSSVCACCQDLAVPTVASRVAISDHARLGLHPDTPYFNAGVLLIDTARWQAEAIGARALDYLSRHAQQLNLFDQEALNVALAGHWLRLSYRWNLIASVAGRSFLAVDPAQQDDYATSLRQPGILHFAGALKPWRNPFLRREWYALYRGAVRSTRPEHEFEPSLKHRAEAVYDGWMRDWLYPLERAVWQARRGSW